MENLLKSDFSLGYHGGWGGRIKQNDNYWKFQIYKGTNLGYDMLCESVNYDQEEKEGDLLSNHIINLKNLITNIDTFLVHKECAQDKDLHIKLEEGKEQESFVAYVEGYFELTPSY